MEAYTLLASAKINLYLEIIGDRPDGYHELAMVMQSVGLCDRVKLRPLGIEAIQLHCDHPEVPTDPTNLAYKAAALMASEFPEAWAQFGGVEITIEKQIPVGAGLAGGSADAAAVLIGLDLMWNLGLTKIELQTLAARLGSDIPFCVTGGTMLATGRGEQLAPLRDLTGLWVILGKYRSLSVSTAWAYQTFRKEFHQSYVSDAASLEQRRQRVHSGEMVAAIAHQEGAKIGQLLYNDLERVVLPAHPEVQRLRESFAAAGVIGTMMSGSGPTVFALAGTQTQAEQVRDQVKAAIANPDLDLWVTPLAGSGIRVVS